MMKYFLGLLIIGFVFVSCSKNPVPKPDNKIEEEVMTNILFDISILQATEGAMSNKLDSANIQIENYIYEKYKIDSTTYYQNIRFYAADSEKYKKMHQEVMKRFDQILSTKKQKEENNVLGNADATLK